MDLTTYTGLQAAIATTLNRDDLVSEIPAFIRLAESQMQSDLRHWRMEKRAETSIDSQFIGLPSDWAETIRLHLNADGTKDIRYITRREMQSMRAGSDDATGAPAYYTHTAGQLEVYPSPDATYSADITYYGTITPLSDSVTNWVLTNFPDVYLYGSLIHTAPFLQEDERTQTWAALYGAAVKRLNDASKQSQASGSGLRLTIKSY
jgi:hypothetical protein